MLASGGISNLNGHDIKLLILFFIGAVIMRGAGCAINDLWDRNLDKRVERTSARPLASGKIGLQAALFFLIILLFLGLLILLQMNIVTVLLGFLSLPLIISYPLMKRITWWPQAYLGLTFNFGALMGWSAVTGVLAWPAVLLYVGGILWTLGYDTIYAHQDKEDDMLAGIKSTALKFAEKSPRAVATFMGGAMACFVLAVVLAKGGHWSLLLLVLPAAHLVWQLKRWDENDPVSSLSVFKSNRDFGLLMLLACLV